MKAAVLLYIFVGSSTHQRPSLKPCGVLLQSWAPYLLLPKRTWREEGRRKREMKRKVKGKAKKDTVSREVPDVIVFSFFSIPFPFFPARWKCDRLPNLRVPKEGQRRSRRSRRSRR